MNYKELRDKLLKELREAAQLVRLQVDPIAALDKIQDALDTAMDWQHVLAFTPDPPKKEAKP